MPVFQVMFNFLDTPMPALRLPGVSLEVLDAHNRTAKFDLNAVVIPHAEERFRDAGAGLDGEPAENITILLEYNVDLFDAATIDRLLEQYRALLCAVVERPDRSLNDLVADRLGLPAVGATS
jgi:hypothetical protein